MVENRIKVLPLLSRQVDRIFLYNKCIFYVQRVKKGFLFLRIFFTNALKKFKNLTGFSLLTFIHKG